MWQLAILDIGPFSFASPDYSGFAFLVFFDAFILHKIG